MFVIYCIMCKQYSLSQIMQICERLYSVKNVDILFIIPDITVFSQDNLSIFVIILNFLHTNLEILVYFFVD